MNGLGLIVSVATLNICQLIMKLYNCKDREFNIILWYRCFFVQMFNNTLYFQDVENQKISAYLILILLPNYFWISFLTECRLCASFSTCNSWLHSVAYTISLFNKSFGPHQSRHDVTVLRCRSRGGSVLTHNHSRAPVSRRCYGHLNGRCGRPHLKKCPDACGTPPYSPGHVSS